MNINSNNYRQFTLFACVLITLSTVVAYALYSLFAEEFSKWPVLLQMFVSIPSIPAVYAGLFLLFDRVLWKWPFFRFLGIVVADDLNGTWEGVLRSSWDDCKTDIPAELIIKQTATSIKIYGKFNESRSVSIHEHFGRNEMYNQTALYYFYKNDPNYDAPPTMSMHEGSTMLAYDRDTKSLAGYYYSGRDRHNHGTIKLTQKKKS